MLRAIQRCFSPKKWADSVTMLLVPSIILGLVLRVYLLSEQILLDDEWHGIDFVAGRSFYHVLTHWNIAGSSAPMNLYILAVLKTTGLSEFMLRLPGLTAGILSLIFFPLAARKLFNDRTTVLFSFFLAISPFLIFHSRFCRSYSILYLLGVASVGSAYLWFTRGKPKYAVFYVVAGGLAIYFHLFAVVWILSPLLFFLFFLGVKKKITLPDHIESAIPPMGRLVRVLLSFLLFPGVLLIPLFWNSSFPFTYSEDRATFHSLWGVARLMSGSNYPFMTFVFAGLFIIGAVRLCKEKPILAGMFTAIITFSLLAILCVNRGMIHIPAVIARYCIILFPISLIAVASGIDQTLILLERIAPPGLANRLKPLTGVIPGGVVLLFFFSGPIPALYGSPNNFTNHAVFQGSYTPINWDQSYWSRTFPGFIKNKEDIPGFYQWLSGQPPMKIVEYPMLVGNHLNFYYFYQHFHKQSVLVGYTRGVTYQERGYRFVFGDQYIDFPLSRFTDPKKLNFRNLLDMDDIRSLKASGASFVILHNNLFLELTRNPYKPRYTHKHLYQSDIYMPVLRLNGVYRRVFGEPVFKDRHITVYRVSEEK